MPKYNVISGGWREAFYGFRQNLHYIRNSRQVQDCKSDFRFVIPYVWAKVTILIGKRKNTWCLPSDWLIVSCVHPCTRTHTVRSSILCCICLYCFVPPCLGCPRCAIGTKGCFTDHSTPNSLSWSKPLCISFTAAAWIWWLVETLCLIDP